MNEKERNPDRLADRQDNYIQKDATNIIKGVALIFMFVHHFFTIPGFYINSVSYPYLERFAKVFAEPFSICVPIFAFLTGYFYSYSKEKTFRYSVKKSTDVWLTYFVVFLLLLIPAVCLNCWDASLKNFILESVGIWRPTMYFCWYVDFYIVSILILPLYYKISKNNILAAIMIGIVLPLILYHYSGRLFDPIEADKYLTFVIKLAKDCLLWFPCIASGVIFAGFNLFYTVFDRLFKNNVKNKILWVFVCLCLIIIPFMGRHYIPAFNAYIVTFSLDFIYAPLFIYSLLNIVYLFKDLRVFYPISLIGKYSLPMWFLHCIFFNSCKEYTQGVLYFLENPVLVLLWGLGLCLGISVVIMIPIKYMIKIKNKILKL